MMLNQRKYLILVDNLSKWSVFKVLRADTSTKTVVNASLEVFSDFGTPEVVISANGPQFVSRKFRQFCLEEHVIIILALPYTPLGMARWRGL